MAIYKNELIELIQAVGKNYLDDLRDQGIKPDSRNLYLAYQLSKITFDKTLPDELQELYLVGDLIQLLAKEGVSPVIQIELEELMNEYVPFSDIKWSTNRDFKIMDVLEKISAELLKKADNNSVQAMLTSPRVKDFENFNIREKLSAADASGRFSHPTQKVRKKRLPESPKSFITWFAKYCPNKEIALREEIAQEFSRLIIPSQPISRIGQSKEGDFYLMSEGVPADTLSLEKVPIAISKKALGENYGKSDGFRGLGSILVICMLLNETDAKLGNMLVLKNGTIIKIDGDFCFTGLNHSRSDAPNDITAADFAALPFISDYSSFNWLDVYTGGKLSPNYDKQVQPDSLIDESLTDNPIFREEVNEATLRALLLPNELILEFLGGYTHSASEKNILERELINRVSQLRQASLENPSFLEYVQSAKAKAVMEHLIEDLSGFKTMSKDLLLHDKNKEYFVPVVQQKFQSLRQGINAAYNNTPAKAFIQEKNARLKLFPPLKPAAKVEETKTAESTLPSKKKIFFADMFKPKEKSDSLPPIIQPPRNIESAIRRALNASSDDDDSAFSNYKNALPDPKPEGRKFLKKLK